MVEIKRCLKKKKKVLTPWKKSYDQPRQPFKKQRHYFPQNVYLVKAMVFPVVMYGYESWTIKKAECFLKNWCFWTVVLEETLKSPLDSKIQPVHPKGNQSWIFIGRTDNEGETPILWPPDTKNWLIWKTLMLGKIEGGKRREWQRWDGWMASLTQWTWVWVDSGSWWWIGRPGVLRLMGSQRVGHNWATELNWTECLSFCQFF